MKQESNNKKTVTLNESQMVDLVVETACRLMREMANPGKLGMYVDKAVEKFNDYYNANRRQCDVYIHRLNVSGVCKDVETHLAYDFARATDYTHWDFLPRDEQGYIAANDAMLRTLFVNALRKSDIHY